MKHLPNILTLANLIFGCMAITFTLSLHPSFSTTGDDVWFIEGMEQLYLGGLFIGLAAFMDMLDGFAARALNSFSPIGKDLDSLADIVSFGVAPSMILFQLLWRSYMIEPGAMETPMLAMAPAFLVACFAALRLARFNHAATKQTAWFNGMPVPATGLIVASLPFLLFYNGDSILGRFFENRWVLYGFIILLCWLMVSGIKFLKWMAPGKGIAAWWPQIIMLLVLIVGGIFLQFAIIPVVFLIYIVSSMVYKYPERQPSDNH